MFSRSMKSRKSRSRKPGLRSIDANAYESLEPRQMLAVTTMFEDPGILTISLDAAADSAVVMIEDGNVLVNGNLVDADSDQAGVQPVVATDITSLIFDGAEGFDDLSAHVQGQFDAGNLVSIRFDNINVATMNGFYDVDFLNATLVGENASLIAEGELTVNSETNISSTSIADLTISNPLSAMNGPVNLSMLGRVEIADSGSVLLGNVDVRNLEIVAATFITDTSMSSIRVSGVTRLTAPAVSLGDSTTPVDLFAVVTNVIGELTLVEENLFIWAGNSTVGEASITAGSILMGPNANIEVINDAVFNVSSLRLGIGGTNTFNSGRLNVNSDGHVFIWENSSIDLFGANTAKDLDLLSSGPISNLADSTLNVENISSFQSATDINVGNAENDQFRSGAVQFFGDDVNINEDSGLRIRGFANFANSLTLTALGNITDADDAFISVQGSAQFITQDDGGGFSDVTLGDTGQDFFVAGSVSFDVENDNITINENDSVVIAGGLANTATFGNFIANGSIQNTEDASINITNFTRFEGSSISIGQQPGDNVQLGSVAFATGGDVLFSEDDSTFFGGSTTVTGDFTATSAGAIADTQMSFFNVTGNASFSGTEIELGDLTGPASGGNNVDIFNAGTIQFNSPGNVSITQNSSIVLAGNTAHTGNVVRLTSVGDVNAVGGITNLAGADLEVASNLFVEAIDDIILGADVSDSISFDNLNFDTPDNVDITALFDVVEDEFFLIGGSDNQNRANELRLTTNVDVRDGTETFTIVDEFVHIEARTIILGDTDEDCLVVPPEGKGSAEYITPGNDHVVDPGCPAP